MIRNPHSRRAWKSRSPDALIYLHGVLHDPTPCFSIMHNANRPWLRKLCYRRDAGPIHGANRVTALMGGAPPSPHRLIDRESPVVVKRVTVDLVLGVASVSRVKATPRQAAAPRR